MPSPTRFPSWLTFLVSFAAFTPFGLCSFFDDLRPALLPHQKPTVPIAITLLYYASSSCKIASGASLELLKWHQSKPDHIQLVFVSLDPTPNDMFQHAASKLPRVPTLKYESRSYSLLKKFEASTTQLLAVDSQGTLIEKIALQPLPTLISKLEALAPAAPLPQTAPQTAPQTHPQAAPLNLNPDPFSALTKTLTLLQSLTQPPSKE